MIIIDKSEIEPFIIDYWSSYGELRTSYIQLEIRNLKQKDRGYMIV